MGNYVSIEKYLTYMVVPLVTVTQFLSIMRDSLITIGLILIFTSSHRLEKLFLKCHVCWDVESYRELFVLLFRVLNQARYLFRVTGYLHN